MHFHCRFSIFFPILISLCLWRSIQWISSRKCLTFIISLWLCLLYLFQTEWLDYCRRRRRHSLCLSVSVYSIAIYDNLFANTYISTAKMLIYSLGFFFCCFCRVILQQMKTYGFARLTGSLVVKNFSIKFISFCRFFLFFQHIFILIDTSDSAATTCPILKRNNPFAKWNLAKMCRSTNFTRCITIEVAWEKHVKPTIDLILNRKNRNTWFFKRRRTNNKQIVAN